MGKRIVLVLHLTTKELAARYRAMANAASARRWHCLWLLSAGKGRDEAAALVGLSSRWVSTLVARYNTEGAAGLDDRLRTNPGKAPLLDGAGVAALAQALIAPPPDGGLWTGRKVARWITERTGTTTNAKRGIVYLRRLDYTPQVPRPCHVHAATAEEQVAFRKA